MNTPTLRSRLIFHGKWVQSVCNKIQRLPDDAKAPVREVIWGDSLYKSGTSLKFSSNGNCFEIVWAKTEADDPFYWMPRIGTSSFDLYKYNENWHYIIGHDNYSAGGAKCGGMTKAVRNYELLFLNCQKFTALKLIINDDTTITINKVDHTKPKVVIYGPNNAQGHGGNGLSYVNWMKKTLSEEIVILAFINAGNKLESAVVQNYVAKNTH